MKKILFPTDFSETSVNAFKYALEVANQFNATITTVHSFIAPMAMATPGVLIQDIVEASEKKEQEEYNLFIRKMHDIAQEEGRMHIEVNNRLEYGLAVDEVVEIAKDEHFDLIVMGTEGSEGFGRWLIGTHTSNVVKKAKCPVLVIPDEAKYRPIKKIAYATDFKNLKEDVLDNLMEWVEKFGAEFHFIHIAHKGEYIDVDEYHNLEEIVEISEKYDNIKFKIIYDNDILEELEDFAEDNGIDVLMMVKRKLSFFQRIFEPSLTQQMTFETEVPLLVFHE
jgi:nucleotide-binding universal stress UspA family protein